ncbi:MAG: hypothetical protein V4562_00670 [Pseudomonadota bacterium]
MKIRLFLVLTLGMAGCVVSSQAQDRVYRCGNEYTNNPSAAKTRDCKLIDGGNVTVIQGTKVLTPGAGGGTAKPPPGITGSPSQRVANDEQKARDTDSRAILESELRRAEAQQAELLKEYNNGEPEKQGGEARNYQKYLDRVAEMKAAIARGDSDIAGIKRELSRLGSAASR